MEVFTPRPNERLNPAVLNDLLEISGGDRQFVIAQVGLYMKRAEHLLLRMTKAAATDDMKLGAESAHALAGSSAMVGANLIRFLSLTAEQYARHNKRHRFQRLSERIVREYYRVREDFEREMADL